MAWVSPSRSKKGDALSFEKFCTIRSRPAQTTKIACIALHWSANICSCLPVPGGGMRSFLCSIPNNGDFVESRNIDVTLTNGRAKTNDRYKQDIFPSPARPCRPAACLYLREIGMSVAEIGSSLPGISFPKFNSHPPRLHLLALSILNCPPAEKTDLLLPSSLFSQ